MEALASNVLSGTCEELGDSINKFLNESANKVHFNELDENDLRRRTWDALFNHLTKAEYYPIHGLCLGALRILSRDKANLEELITKERIELLLKNAGLTNGSDEQIIPCDVKVTSESLKVLCNFLYNSPKAKTLVLQTSCLPRLVERMGQDSSASPHDVKLFDSRVLFLVTTLDIPARNVVKAELRGDLHLIDILCNISLKHWKERNPVLTDDETALACEVLKVLFNLNIHVDDETEEEEKYEKLVSILYRLLLCRSNSRQNELQGHIVHLLIVVPMSSYSAIIPPAQKNEGEEVYQNVDMKAVSALLHFLDQRLDCESDLVENISPVLTAFIRLIKAQRLIRKYVRLQVLPPLKDVMKRPEEGTSVRAKLCKLLTSPITELRDLAAELVFVLCKENVGRMVKYTGYGNAAGMFANRGLLGGRQPDTAYSSESGDSDTDEYIKYREQINPVTGCYERPRQNPMEGMSEERKEYEALQLVGLMDKLTRGGIVQPCRIGEDGRPQPIEHVLELQNELPKQHGKRQDSDSD